MRLDRLARTRTRRGWFLIVEDLTALAGQYHRDKLDHRLHYPKEFVAGPGASRATFDYFPEHHYRQGFEQLHATVADDTVDEWIDAIVGKEPIGCEHGGLWREDIPDLVADILSSSHRYEAEITIRPEGIGDGYDYLVEWQYIDYDRDDREWKPVNELEMGDAEST